MYIQPLEVRHGSILCIGFIVGNLLAKRRKKNEQSMDTSPPRPAGKNTEDEDRLAVVIAAATVQLVAMIDSAQISIALAACTALGEIGRSGELPLKDGVVVEADVTAVGDDGPKGVVRGGGVVVVEEITKLVVVDKLIAKVQSQKENTKVCKSVYTTIYIFYFQCR